jgi:eukaryotic-like serine/threonine-protein kinase
MDVGYMTLHVGERAAMHVIAEPWLAAPTRIGRFRVLDRLGEGGMGVVYAAYDPVLDRRVALKRVRGELARSLGAELLLREAKALARLAHPNVVGVYDVVVDGEDVVMSMEMVEGQTLAAWLADGPPPTREVIAVLLAAGEGLRAAHRAGIVHRDVKPDNLLIGRDGRARVIDFGIASEGSAAVAASPQPAPPGDATPLAADDPLVIAGTPRYTAPELRAGGRADPRSDQWSFCRVARDALGPGAPHCHAALDRGLREEPGARWPELGPILRAMRRELGRRRRNAIVAIVGAVGAVAIGAAVFAGHEWGHAAAAADRCQLDPAAPGVFGDAERAELEARWLGPGTPRARSEWATFARLVDEFRTSWRGEWQAACRATRITGVQSERQLDARMECLDRGVGAARQLIALAREASDGERHTAVDAAAVLGDPRGCDAAARRRARLAPPPAAAGRVAQRLDRVRLLSAMARREALDEARATVSDAERVGDRPVLGEALVELGKAWLRAANIGEARASFERAYFVALGAGDDPRALTAAGHLVSVLGYSQGDDAGWRAWARHAEALVERAPGEPAELALRMGLGAAYARADRWADARREAERAVRIDHARGGPAIEASGLLATALSNLGERAAAVALYEPVLPVAERVRGAWHPATAHARLALATMLTSIGRYGDSERHLRRGLELVGSGTGAEAALRAELLGPLAWNLALVGDLEEAHAHVQAALALHEQARGPQALRVGEALLDVVSVEWDRDPAAAEAASERACALFEAKLGGDHLQTAVACGNRGELRGRRGDPRGALRWLDRAIAILDRAQDGDDARATRLEVEAHRADALLALGRVEEAARAVGGVERSIARTREASYGTARARLWFALARVRARQGDRVAAAAAADNAAQLLTDRARPVRRLRAELEAWRGRRG